MKIAIYSGGIPSTTFIERLINAVASNGYTVYLFGKIEREIKYESTNIKIFSTNSNRFYSAVILMLRAAKLLISKPKYFFKYFFWAYQTKKKYYELLKQLPVVLHMPDVFHIQWAKGVDQWFFLKELFGVKVVVSLRGAHINYSPLVNDNLKIMYQKYFPYCDRFHAVSNDIKQAAVGFGAQPEKIEVIYSGIKHSGPLKKNYETKGTLKLISIGRYHWPKGYDFALRAIQLLKERNFDVYYTILGDGNPEECLFLQHELQLQEITEISGPIAHDKLFEKLLSYDALLLPSVSEGISNVAIESMSVGLPVLSTNVNGMGELISNRYNGLLFESSNADAMADAIEYFYSLTAHEREAISHNAIKSLQGKFDYATFYSSVNSFYKKLM